MSARILVVSLGGAAVESISDPLLALGHAVTAVNGPAAAQRELRRQDLVILEAKGGGLAEACRKLRAAEPAGPPMIAVAAGLDVEQRIALIEAGADDVLGRPFDARQLELLVEALLARSKPVPSSALATIDSGNGAAPRQPGGPGRIICFAAAKGGAGTTTLAVNTALALARGGLSVAIADLDFHHGQVAAHLNTPTVHTTADLVHALTGEDDDDREALGDAVVAHESGLLVYGAPARPDQASATSADDVIELARALRLTHPLVVIDAGSVPGTRALALLGLADESVIVVSPDIPGLRALTGTLAAMTDSGIVGEQNRFVVNRTFAAQQIDRRDIEQNLGVSVSLEIPFDGESCLRAVNEGQPVLTLNPRSPVSAAIENLATMLIGAATPATADAEPVRRRSRVGALLRRR